jgi:hypothetical protein
MAFKGMGETQLNVDAGTAGSPSVVGDGDTNTGLAWIAGDELSLCAGGAVKAEVTSAGLGVIDGAEATPSVHFSSEADTGTYLYEANVLAISTEGTCRLQIVPDPGPNQRMIIRGILELGGAPATAAGLGGLGGRSGIWYASTPEMQIMPWDGTNTSHEGLHFLPSQIEIGGISRYSTVGIGTSIHTGYRINNQRVQTTDATPTAINTSILLDNYLYLFEAFVVARDEAGVERATYKIIFQAHRQSAGVAVLGTVTTLYSEETNAAMDCTAVVSGNNVIIQGTGLAGVTIAWLATVKASGMKQV